VAHTKDDQAETFLLRLLRGAGPRGLAGIRPRRGRVIRPLLDVARADLRAYLDGLREPFREDVSNFDVSVPRNRVRHELLPLLASRFNPAIVDVLSRESVLASREEDYLQQQAAALEARVVTRRPSGVELDAAALLAAPSALGARVAFAAITQLAGRRPVGFEHVERLLDLAAGPQGRALSLPGQHALRAGAFVVLTPGRGPVRGESNSLALSLSIPGEVQSDGWAISAELSDPAERPIQYWRARGSEVGVAVEALRMPLAVRNRRPGDRFRPLGAPGARKLQDFLVDRKIARAERGTLPLVVDGLDRIVWVPGQSVAEDFRVTDPSQGVILLKVRRLGGLA
jgi:tRNA(Ile)-lysidine synthase